MYVLYQYGAPRWVLQVVSWLWGSPPQPGFKNTEARRALQRFAKAPVPQNHPAGVMAGVSRILGMSHVMENEVQRPPNIIHMFNIVRMENSHAIFFKQFPDI
jgi:hypothetical protein